MAPIRVRVRAFELINYYKKSCDTKIIAFTANNTAIGNALADHLGLGNDEYEVYTKESMKNQGYKTFKDMYLDPKHYSKVIIFDDNKYYFACEIIKFTNVTNMPMSVYNHGKPNCQFLFNLLEKIAS